MFASAFNVPTIESPSRREIHKQTVAQKQAAANTRAAVKPFRISTSRVVIGGNIILAIAYGIFYGYTAGIFN